MPVLAIYAQTDEITRDAVSYLRDKGWTVLDAPDVRTVEFHAERQLYNEGYNEIGISRQAGLCTSCEEFFSNNQT